MFCFAVEVAHFCAEVGVSLGGWVARGGGGVLW